MCSRARRKKMVGLVEAEVSALRNMASAMLAQHNVLCVRQPIGAPGAGTTGPQNMTPYRPVGDQHLWICFTAHPIRPPNNKFNGS